MQEQIFKYCYLALPMIGMGAWSLYQESASNSGYVEKRNLRKLCTVLLMCSEVISINGCGLFGSIYYSVSKNVLVESEK